MQSIPDVYYQQQQHYPMSNDEHHFHDSGIADSDETGSVEDESNNKENNSDEDGTPKKPNQSYLEIIAEAILKAPNRMMQLFEIYHYFQRKYRYFAEDVNKSWKNSVRHNLSLNDCFVKAGRGTNGKGHYWRIHDLAESEFEQGRFRRRRYRQQMRQMHMHAASSVHNPSYGIQSVSSFYPQHQNSASAAAAYYMCSPPPSYHAVYPTTNNLTENHPMSPPPPPSTLSGLCSPSSYSLFDPYTTPYYPSYHSSPIDYHHHPLASSYASPNESTTFDV